MKFCNSGGEKQRDWGLLLLRVFIGVAFIAHGYTKVQNLPGTVEFFGGLGFSAFWAYLVAWVELLGGVALVAGLWTCLAGGLLAIVMLVVIWITKGGSFFAIELPLVLLGGLLAIILVGPGKFRLFPNLSCCKSESIDSQ